MIKFFPHVCQVTFRQVTRFTGALFIVGALLGFVVGSPNTCAADEEDEYELCAENCVAQYETAQLACDWDYYICLHDTSSPVQRQCGDERLQCFRRARDSDQECRLMCLDRLMYWRMRRSGLR